MLCAQLDNLPSSLHLNSQSFSLSLTSRAWAARCLLALGRTGLTLAFVGAKTDTYHFLELSSHHCPSRFQARFDAGELITQRELVSRQVSEDLTERAATFGLILDDVSLVRVPFLVFLFGVCPNKSSRE